MKNRSPRLNRGKSGWPSHVRPRRHRFLWGLGQGQSKNGMKPAESARLGRLEAVLFLARAPLALRKLAQLANLTDGTEARTLLRTLQERYDNRGCAFQVAQVAGGYQLLSRRDFA